MFPSLAALRELEHDTLRTISESGVFARLPHLRAAAKAGLRNVNLYRGGLDVYLGFVLEIRLRGDKTSIRRWVDVGALVVPTADNNSIRSASYGTTICRTHDPSRSAIVRKFHVDYEPIDFRNPGEPKPTVHMQICGNLSPHQLANGYTPLGLRPLFPRWEKPRIPTPPVSMALLLNWLLLEFQSDPASQPILNDHRWRNNVARAERTVLGPYFDQAAAFLAAAKNSKNRFCQVHLYELGSESA